MTSSSPTRLASDPCQTLGAHQSQKLDSMLARARDRHVQQQSTKQALSIAADDIVSIASRICRRSPGVLVEGLGLRSVVVTSPRKGGYIAVTSTETQHVLPADAKSA